MFTHTVLDPPPGRLLDAAREFASALSLDDVTAVVRRHARELTGADGVTFVLRDEDRCYYVDEEAIAPLWKGKRFPMETCISGWVMQNRSPAVIEDIYVDDRIPHDAYRPTFVQSLAMVPIRSDEPIGAIGAYWADTHQTTDAELETLQVLADFAAVALRNVELIRALEAEEARYRAIVEDQTELIVRWSPAGELTFVNDAYCRFFQRSRDDLLGKEVFSSIHESDRPAVRKKIETLSPERPTAVDQRRIVREDGESAWTEWVDRAVFDERGEVREYQSVGRDITDRKALEEQLHEAQKMDAIGRLAGGVAHDFNNVLTVIAGNSELALQTLGADHPARPELEEVKEAAARAESLTRQLLAVSRTQTLEPEVVDLNRVVGGMESMLVRLIGEDVELSTRLAPDLGSVWADEGQVEQVILNLTVNARDAMPEGGRLTIETRNAHLSDEAAEYRLDVDPGDYVMLAVSDDGAGMSREVQEHVFEPFFTTKAEERGTGLGLSIVFGIVKQSRGSIYVYSEPGEGTTFKIYLPRIEEPAPSAVPGATTGGEEAGPGGETILLVEDDDAIRKLGKTILEKSGYRVLAAGTAEEARALFSDEAVDLLITDMVLPGASGLDLARELRSSGSDLRVMFVSGHTENSFGEHRTVSPVFLEKPFHVEALLAKTREALRVGTAGGTPDPE